MRGIPPWLDTGGTRPDDEFYDGPGDIPVFTVPEGMDGKYLVSWHGTLLGGSGHIEKVGVSVDGGPAQILTVFPAHDDDMTAQTQAILDLKGGQAISINVTAPSANRRSVVTRLG